MGAVDLVVIFGLSTSIGKKGNNVKNKTNTDPNPTTIPNPKPPSEKVQSKRN